MRLRRIRRLLKPESLGGEPTEQDLTPAQEAVEKSRIALEQVEEQQARARKVVARARKIQERNGFGQLAEQLFQAEIDRRRRPHGGAH